MKRELRASWRSAGFQRGVRLNDASSQFRDPTRQDVFHQIDSLRASIKRIEQRLFKAARNEDASRVGKLSSLLANQRARVQMLADRTAIDGLKERQTVSRDKLAFGIGNRDDLGLLITGPMEGKPTKAPPDPVMRKGDRLFQGKVVSKRKGNRFYNIAIHDPKKG
jgi:hypothetical protein